MNKIQNIFFLSLILCFCPSLSVHGQSAINFEDYAGLWKGSTSDDNPFQITVTIKDLDQHRASILLSNHQEILRTAFAPKDTLYVPLEEKMLFEGIVNKEGTQIQGFIKLDMNFYPLLLEKKGQVFKGTFKLSAIHYLQADSYYLEIRKVYNSVEGYGAYPLLGTYWVNDLEIISNNINFEDYKTGLVFEGKLLDSQIILDVRLASKVLCTLSYKRVDRKEKVKSIETEGDWPYADQALSLSNLERDIAQNKLKGIESVLLAHEGKIRYEKYFNATNSETTNDLRSAGKSIGSAIIGCAIDDGIISNTQEKVFDHIPSNYQYTNDKEKAEMTIKHLLTMRSGIGVYENDYQETDDWLKSVLEPKLKYKAGSRTNYMSADPFLLSVNLNERLPYPLEFYMQQKLFAPLGIENYIMNTDMRGIPYFAGGIYMRPSDMLKFGQLYLDKGMWKGKRILSEKWINTSFEKHTLLENTAKKNAYGYLWWHESYDVNGTSISCIEARGNGGQYISIIPELDAVIVVTTENYNKRGAAEQTERIIAEYILASLLSQE